MKATLAHTGTIMAALAASACCWIPAVLGTAAAGSLGASSVLAPWRPYLLILTGLFISAGFYMAYAPLKRTCCGTDERSRRAQSKRKVSIGTMWLVFAVALGSAAYPILVGAKFGSSPTASTYAATPNSTSRLVYLKLSGLDCAACAGPIQQGLQGVPGVLQASVDYPKRLATVQVKERGASNDQLIEIVKKLGFKASVIKNPGGSK